MAINVGKARLKKEVAKDKKKLKGRLGLAKDDLESCAKKIAGQAEDMSMSEAIKLCRSINKKK